MQYELPHDPDGSWRASLTGWQLADLKKIVRGKYERWGGQDRIVVKVTDYGFDVIGLREADVMDREGNIVPDTWVVVWVNCHHPDVARFHTSKTYGPSVRKRRPRYVGHEEWGMKMWRTVRRRARRQRARDARKEARRLAELKAYEDGLAQHVKEGWSPLTYHPEGGD